MSSLLSSTIPSQQQGLVPFPGDMVKDPCVTEGNSTHRQWGCELRAQTEESGRREQPWLQACSFSRQRIHALAHLGEEEGSCLLPPHGGG